MRKKIGAEFMRWYLVCSAFGAHALWGNKKSYKIFFYDFSFQSLVFCSLFLVCGAPERSSPQQQLEANAFFMTLNYARATRGETSSRINLSSVHSIIMNFNEHTHIQRSRTHIIVVRGIRRFPALERKIHPLFYKIWGEASRDGRSSYLGHDISHFGQHGL